MALKQSSPGTIRTVLVVIAALILAPMLMLGAYYGTVISPFWGLGMMAFWLVLLVGGAFILYQWLARSSGVATDPALAELRLSYARGELSEDGFDERRRKLKGN